jgi:hypothetical protein
VTAIAAGNATITAAASTGQSAAASVSVAAPAAAISGLQVSPTAASVQVNQTVAIVPTVNKGGAAVAVAYTYATSTATVATVTAAGVVTAVGPGTAVITVTATGTGTGFTATTLTSAAAVTVTALPTGITSLTVTPSTLPLAVGATAQLVANAQQPSGAAAAAIIYGTTAPTIANVSATGLVTAVAPGSAVITVTATSALNANFAAATLSSQVAVTVSPAAQVTISSLTKTFLPVDISDVYGQFEVNLAVQPNGQNVSSVQAWICEAGETVAACAARSGAPAAQQTFGAQGGQAGTVQLYINSAEFAAPNFTTGADANTLYKNGLKTIVATLTTSDGSPTASNNVSAINFNNFDGFTLSWTLPSNKAPNAQGLTYYGGPNGAGTGSFTVVPVIYTPGRTITSVVLSPGFRAEDPVGAPVNSYYIEPSCVNDEMLDTSRPFRATYGAQPRDTVAMAFDCTGAETDAGTGHAPEVLASLTNDAIAGPAVIIDEPVVGLPIFLPIAYTRAGLTQPLLNGNFYRQSLAYRQTSTAVPADYAAPIIETLNVRGGGSTSPDSGWVNGDYAFNEITSAAGAPVRRRYEVVDASVGLPTARNTVFSVCNTPAFTPGEALTAPVLCTTPVATGGLSATVASMGLQENADNLENTAYFLTATETDKLGNRVTSNAFQYDYDDDFIVPATSAGNTFGVDRTKPQIVAIPAPSAEEPAAAPSLAGFARTTIDSIFSINGNTVNAKTSTGDVAINAANALFAVRAKDERSGFSSCTAENCYTNNGVRLGTFGITRRIALVTPSVTNSATVQNIVSSSTATGSKLGNTMNGVVPGTDNTIRQFSINIFGNAGRGSSAVVEAVAKEQSGYYTFTGTLVDRAGNTTTIPARNVVIDNTAPVINSIVTNAGAFYTGGQTAGVALQASDDLEIMGAELTLGFEDISVRFPRVTQFASTIRTGLFHNPFATLTDNKLASLIGLGQNYTGAVNLPIPFIQDLQELDTANEVVQSPAANELTNKPAYIDARVFDVRAMATLTNYDAGATWSTNAFSSLAELDISSNQVSTPAKRKNWGADDAVNNNAGAKIGTWSVYSVTSTAVEFRVTATSSSASVPFNAVRVVTRRQNASTGAYDEDYEYRGTATLAETLDEGGVRVFRYLWTIGAAVVQGANVSQAAFTGLDSVRAIGTDASGNGLLTAAAIPGATTVPKVYSAIAVGAINVLPAKTGVDSLGTWWSKSNASTQVKAALDIKGDARVFVGLGSTDNTARIWYTITKSAGVSDPTIGNTTLTCTSDNPDVVVVGSGFANRFTTKTPAVNNAYCDVQGITTGVATITFSAARSAEAPYLASTAANTVVTQTMYTAPASILAAGSFTKLADPVYVASPGTSTTGYVTVSAPTFNTGFSNANVTMEYVPFMNAYTVGVSFGTPVVNPLTGGVQISVTCGSTAVQNTEIPMRIIARGVSSLGYSAPQAVITVTGLKCNPVAP